jgi:hypothetical protein
MYGPPPLLQRDSEREIEAGDDNATVVCGLSDLERMEQIDFTGPFESLSRMPDTTVQIIGKEVEQVRRWTWRLRRGFGNEENMTALPIASQVIADPEARNHAKKLNAKV